jgi:hypothetical protein
MGAGGSGEEGADLVGSVPEAPLLLGDPMEGDATSTAITLRWRRPEAATGDAPLLATCIRWRASEMSDWNEVEIPSSTEQLAVLDVDAWTLSALLVGTEYDLGVRLQNAHGWGEWAAARGRTRGGEQVADDSEPEEEDTPQTPALFALG